MAEDILRQVNALLARKGLLLKRGSIVDATIIAEAPRFPQLGTLFFSTVTQRGLAIITALLQEAREQQFIADLDFDVVTHTLLGGLLTYVLMSLVLGGEEAQPPELDRADAVVEVIMRVLKP